MDPDLTRLAFEDAVRACPGLAVPFEAFATRVAAALSAAGSPGLAQLETEDLYLCAGCLLGLPQAHALLERRHLSRLPALLSRFAAQGVPVDDVVQDLRVKLLGAKGGPARLLQYTGRGSLDRWLEAAALRAAIDARRAQRSLQPLSDGAGHLAAGGVELSHLRAELREPFCRAVKSALLELPPRSRRVLALHYLHGLTTARIAALYGTHRITVTRWLVTSRQEILAAVKAALGAELGPGSSADPGSAFRLLRSDLTLSLPRLLGEGE